LDAQFLLQALDLPAERGLGDFQAPGGAAEVEFLGDREERLELAEGHVLHRRLPFRTRPAK
jgi:hypothetical protein